MVHSLHAYFLRRGDCNAPIVYEVDRSLDGHSFSNRRVVAIQHGEQIFNMTASFQVAESGFDHQIAMPQVPPPEELPDSSGPPPQLLERLPERVRRFFEQPRPFEFRTVQPIDYLQPAARSAGAPDLVPRGRGRCPTTRCCTGACSPTCRTSFCSIPRRCRTAPRSCAPSIVMASIDHAMWFHRPLRVDDWLLYAIESPSASGARGFARASVFARDGRLVASAAQEGLVRLKKDR